MIACLFAYQMRTQDPGAPGHLLAIQHPKGASGKPTSMSYFAVMSKGGNHSTRSDDRTRVSASLADPYNGRYAAKVNLASSTPVRISLPVLLPPPHQVHHPTPQEKTLAAEYDFQLWVRSSPPGVKVEVASSMFEFMPPATSTFSSTATTSATTQWSPINATLRLKNASAATPPRNCNVPPYPPCDLPLEVKLTSPLEIGGTLFLDGISLYPKH